MVENIRQGIAMKKSAVLIAHPVLITDYRQ